MLSIRDSCVGALGALCALRFWEGGRPLRASPRSSVSTGRRRVSLSMYIYINIRDASLFPATQSMQCRCYGSWSQPMSTLSVSNCRSMRLQCEWKVNRRTVWWLADTRTFTVKAKIVSRHDIPRAPDEQSPWQTPTNHLADSYGFWAAPLRALILARGRYCAK